MVWERFGEAGGCWDLIRVVWAGFFEKVTCGKELKVVSKSKKRELPSQSYIPGAPLECSRNIREVWVANVEHVKKKWNGQRGSIQREIE